MKQYKLIMILVAVALTVGCRKVLDKTNLEAIDQSEIWNDFDLANAAINNVYAQSLPGWSTEYADYSEESDGGGSFLYGQLTENSVNYWPYNQIRDINVVLANIDRGTLKATDKQRIKGEAFFFRAWQYFEMMKRYGGVPLVLTPQTLGDDLFVERATTTATMQQIIKDIDSAIANLPTISAANMSQNDGHVHKGTAMAVKGRMLLTYASPQFDPQQNAAGRWQAAYDANKDAKAFLAANGFGLFTSFGGLWFNEMNREVIFVRRYLYTPGIANTFHNWSAATRPLDESQGATGGNRPTWEMVQAFPMKDGKKINDPASSFSYDVNYYWRNRDPRFYETIAYNGAYWGIGASAPKPGRIQFTYVGGEIQSPTATGFYMKKAVDTTQSSIQAFNSSTDWIELRYAEVLMNLAEAANEVGKPEEAYVELKALRARAGILPGAGSMYGLEAGLGKAQLRDAIIYERQIEFAFEAKRFWDLRRLRRFESELNGKRRNGLRTTLKTGVTKAQIDALSYAQLEANYAQYFNQQLVTTDTQFPINWKPEYYFFAIPTTTLQLNSKLKQTNGWAGGSFDPLQ